MSDLTKRQVQARLKGLDDETAKSVVCALVGHSRIQEACFGYFHCARCGAQVGDSLASVYPGAETAVLVGHNCGACRENAKTLTWRDTLLAPDPFAVVEEAEVHPGERLRSQRGKES